MLHFRRFISSDASAAPTEGGPSSPDLRPLKRRGRERGPATRRAQRPRLASSAPGSRSLHSLPSTGRGCFGWVWVRSALRWGCPAGGEVPVRRRGSALSCGAPRPGPPVSPLQLSYQRLDALPAVASTPPDGLATRRAPMETAPGRRSRRLHGKGYGRPARGEGSALRLRDGKVPVVPGFTPGFTPGAMAECRQPLVFGEGDTVTPPLSLDRCRRTIIGGPMGQ